VCACGSMLYVIYVAFSNTQFDEVDEPSLSSLSFHAIEQCWRQITKQLPVILADDLVR